MPTTGILNSYQEVGKKEDVSNVITNIAPTMTPFQTAIGTDSIHNTLFQWLEDTLLAVNPVPQVEGFTAAAATWQQPVLRNNTTQIFTKTAQTSGTTDAVTTYGRERELPYQMMLRSKELKRDREFALIGTAQTSVAGSAGVAGQFAGYQAQCAAGNILSVGTSSVAAPLTETAMLNLWQTLYNAGADPNTLMVKPADKQRVASFQTGTTGRTVFIDNGEKSLTNTVDIYEGPYGKCKVVMNRFIRGGPNGGAYSDALLFDPAMWKMAILRNWKRVDLAKTGDNTPVMIVGEFSLKHMNQLASGYLTYLS